MYIYRESHSFLRGKNMVATKTDQKSTAMDYLSAPRSEGLVVSLLTLLGFTAPKNGRLPAGVKYDSLIAMRDVFSLAESTEIISMIGGSPFFHPTSETKRIIATIPAVFGTNAKKTVTADAAPW